MKIAGKKLEAPSSEVVVLPRADGDIVFIAEAVLDYEPFEKMCPAPVPPEVVKPGGITIQNVESPKYKQAIQSYAEKRTAWTIIKSLGATKDLEWELVDLENPETWPKYLDEFRDSMFSEAEITRIVQAVLTANGLDDSKIEEARNRFLAEQREQAEKSSSQTVEVNTTQSGEAANG